MPQGRPRILVPGRMNKRVLDRLPDHFAPVFVSAADPALITADIAAGVSGVAVQGKIPNDRSSEISMNLRNGMRTPPDTCS